MSFRGVWVLWGMGGAEFCTVLGSWGGRARSTYPASGVPLWTGLPALLLGAMKCFFQGFSHNPNFDDPCSNSWCSFCVGYYECSLRGGLVGRFCPL